MEVPSTLLIAGPIQVSASIEMIVNMEGVYGEFCAFDGVFRSGEVFAETMQNIHGQRARCVVRDENVDSIKTSGIRPPVYDIVNIGVP